jgi:hypothetical protein
MTIYKLSRLLLDSRVVDLLMAYNPVVYLAAADKYRGLTHRPSQEQTGLDERALMASQRPSHPL